MLSRDKITEIFVSVDDFCQEFEPMLNSKLIGKAKIRNKPSKLSMSEVMTIQIICHYSYIELTLNIVLFEKVK